MVKTMGAKWKQGREKGTAFDLKQTAKDGKWRRRREREASPPFSNILARKTQL
jgi:hypothetical protein